MDKQGLKAQFLNHKHLEGPIKFSKYLIVHKGDNNTLKQICGGDQTCG